jgi:transporter family-2 protein
MITYILLALLNGVIVGASRAINSRLSMYVGTFKASFYNHVVGFIFLTLLTIGVIALGKFQFPNITNLPLYGYLGGVFGALQVAVGSYVFHRIGAMKTVLLVISGQMISGVIIGYRNVNLISTLGQFLGIAIIIFGVYLANASYARRHKDISEKLKSE